MARPTLTRWGSGIKIGLDSRTRMMTMKHKIRKSTASGRPIKKKQVKINALIEEQTRQAGVAAQRSEKLVDTGVTLHTLL